MDYKIIEVKVILLSISNGYGVINLSVMGRGVQLHVYVNPLLVHYLSDDTNLDYKMNTVYSSLNNSDDYKSNPFTVVKYLGEEGEVKYYLTLVNKAKTEIGNDLLPSGDKVTTYKNYYYPKTSWYRYIDTSSVGFNPIRKKVFDDVNIVLINEN